MPHGQNWYGGGVITDFHSEDAGMYSVLDNSGAYGDLTTYARRGLLLTNDRRTTVIQDEISFNNVQSAVWTAHTTAGISLMNDGRTAYLQTNCNGKVLTLRVSIVSENEKYKFEITGAGVNEADFLLNATNRPNFSTDNGGLAEYGRSSIKRLIIRASNTLNFNIAVVIERVDSMTDNTPVAYTYTPIKEWTVYDSFIPTDDTTVDENLITTAKLTDVKKYSTEATRLWDNGYALTTRTFEFFKALVRVNAAVNTYRPEVIEMIPNMKEHYANFVTLKALYDTYKAAVNGRANDTRQFAQRALVFN
jgi:hypothetical protein